MAEAQEEIVTLVSSDNEAFQIRKSAAVLAKVVERQIEDVGTGESIPIPQVNAKIMKKVVQYLDHVTTHYPPEIEKPLKSANFDELVAPFYAEYMNADQEIIFGIIQAANYMEIDSLLKLSCAKVATMLKNKSAEEIRKTFNIENDFTPEEEQQIIEENKWASEDA